MVETTYRHRGRPRPGWGPPLFAELMERSYRSLLEQPLPERLVRLVAQLAERETNERQAA